MAMVSADRPPIIGSENHGSEKSKGCFQPNHRLRTCNRITKRHWLVHETSPGFSWPSSIAGIWASAIAGTGAGSGGVFPSLCRQSDCFLRLCPKISPMKSLNERRMQGSSLISLAFLHAVSGSRPLDSYCGIYSGVILKQFRQPTLK